MPTTDQTQIEAQTDAASGMLAALKVVYARWDGPDYDKPTFAEQDLVRDAIREAEAAGIVAGDC